MYTKKISAVLLAVALATTMFAGCGKGSGDDTKDTKQQESQNAVATESIAGTEGVTETESQGAQSQYPEITSDGKVKSYQGVVAVDDAAYELYTYLDDVAGNYADSINKVASALDGKADVYDMVIPLSSEITFPDNLKDEINSSDQHQAMQDIQAKMNDKVKSVDIYDALMQHRNEYIYFRTDHHWTTEAAFYVYQNWAAAQKLPVRDADHYEIRTVTDAFEGTIQSKLGIHTVTDSIDLYLAEGDPFYTVQKNGSEEVDYSIYDYSTLDTKDKYAVFFGGNQALVKISTRAKADRRFLVIQDSYAHCFLPFLFEDASEIDVVDLRYYNQKLSDLIAEGNYTDVLFLYNVAGFAEDTSLAKLLG